MKQILGSKLIIMKKIYYAQTIGSIALLIYLIYLVYNHNTSFPLFGDSQLSKTLLIGRMLHTVLFGLCFNIYCYTMIKQDISLSLLQGQLEETERLQAKKRLDDRTNY